MGGPIPRSPDFVAHLFQISALPLDLGSSVQGSDVGLCLYLHLLADKVSMVIFKIFISVAMGEVQLGTLSSSA